MRRKAEPERDGGFTLLELMMSVAVIAVLMAIALPMVIGFRKSAQDRAAHADLRNVMQAEQMIHLETGAFTDVLAEVAAIRPGSPLAADPAVGVYVDVNDASDQIVCVVRESASGNAYSIWHHAVTGSHYGSADLSAADCPAAAPAGFVKDGF